MQLTFGRKIMTNVKVNRGTLTCNNNEPSGSDFESPEKCDVNNFRNNVLFQGEISNAHHPTSQVLSSTTSEFPDSTLSSSTDVYKMITNGGLKQSPAHIEFNLYKKARSHYHRRYHPGNPLYGSLPNRYQKSKPLLSPKNNIMSKAKQLKEQRIFQNKSAVPFNRNAIEEDLLNEDKGRAKKVDCGNSNEFSERCEFYFFDHGNQEFLYTTDFPPNLKTEQIAQNTIDCATRFWAEFYGSIHIGIAFMVAFLLQTYRFILYSLIRPTIVGLLQMTSDYMVKPIIATAFNGFIQPPIRLLQNIFVAVCDMSEPIANMFGNFLRPIKDMVQALRFIEVHNYNYQNKLSEHVNKESIIA